MVFFWVVMKLQAFWERLRSWKDWGLLFGDYILDASNRKWVTVFVFLLVDSDVQTGCGERHSGSLPAD